MSGPKSDILVEIPDNNLLKLATLYAKKAFWAPYMVSFICTSIRWKKSQQLRDLVKITSPNNTWEKDGTIIAIMQFEFNNEIIVFTLDDEGKNLYEGLMNTALIEYQKRVVFYGIHEKHVSTVTKYLQNKKIAISLKVPCHIYAIHPEDATSINTEVPSDVYVKKLDSSNAKQINSIWLHRFPGSESYLSVFIEANGAYGLFLKSTNELVAWALRHTWGNLGVIQTEESHKKKGYGSLIAKILSKQVAQEGQWPLSTIQFNNCAAMNMFSKMEFTRIGDCTFIIVQGSGGKHTK